MEDQLFGTDPIRVESDLVREVFDHWVIELRSNQRGPQPVLSEPRRKLIKKALSDYGIDNCKLAIDGCKRSDWHMGENPSGKRYNDIELIFRNSRNIERFIDMAFSSPSFLEDERF